TVSPGERRHPTDCAYFASRRSRHSGVSNGLSTLHKRPRSQELARRGLRLAVPHHRRNFTWVDHGPPGLTLQTHQAVRVNLHAGQFLVFSCDEPDGTAPADNHGNQSGLTDEGREQVADRLSGHQPSPPHIATSSMPRNGQSFALRGVWALLDGGIV